MPNFKLAKAVQNVARFFNPSVSKCTDPREDFDQAKKECIASLEAQLEEIKELSADSFLRRNGGFSIMPVPVKFELADEAGGSQEPISMMIEHSNDIAYISFNDHGSFYDKGNGSQVIVSQFNGEISIRVYSDINLEGPTYDISLKEARKINRS